MPKSHVFAMGDNRPQLERLALLGSAMPLAEIKGRGFGIWFARGRSGPRWERIGGVD